MRARTEGVENWVVLHSLGGDGLAALIIKGLEPGTGLASGQAKDKQKEFLSKIIDRLNEIFAGDGLTEDDMQNYARTIKDKVAENQRGVTPIADNTREQALLGDFPGAVEEAILNSNEAQQKQMIKLLSMSEKLSEFQNAILDMFQTMPPGSAKRPQLAPSSRSYGGLYN
ncbi:hypothetical protein OO012_19785 [Rhodobacteraceae bacterium KMM 6894]|nr:hypothetical protein [Rhodobacteraceae bacterium KMM 6894]